MLLKQYPREGRIIDCFDSSCKSGIKLFHPNHIRYSLTDWNKDSYSRTETKTVWVLVSLLAVFEHGSRTSGFPMQMNLIKACIKEAHQVINHFWNYTKRAYRVKIKILDKEVKQKCLQCWANGVSISLATAVLRLGYSSGSGRRRLLLFHSQRLGNCSSSLYIIIHIYQQQFEEI